MPNININVQGGASDMVPKKVNLFALHTTDSGVMLDCVYNTKQVDANGNCPAFISSRFLVDPGDLKSLADSIYEHLRKTGFIEQ